MNEDTLEIIAGEVRACQNCVLHHSRKNSVPGTGPADAQIMFIGEGPGFHENERGLPFVGQAGKFLDELLEKGGLSRETVYITNVVKCRPPENRDPLPEELQACNAYLERQIALINPLVIVTLGRFSMAKFMPYARISEAHGKAQWIKERLIVPMYHPAAALHQPKWRPTLLDDFAKLPMWIEKARQRKQEITKTREPAPEPAEPEKDEPEQLSLF